MPNKVRMIGVAASLLFIVVGTTLWGLHWTHAQSTSVTTKPTVHNPTPIQVATVESPVTVMGIGGSVAHGWDDKSGGGYLARAFQTLTKEQNVQYQFVNKSIEGDGPTQMATSYAGFLTTVKPKVVVISWGMLDDMSKKTPLNEFRQAIHTEIADALADNMDVIVVTPPVTGASLSAHDEGPETNLINIEMSIAEQFHSKHVYVFDVFRQMQAYLKMNGQSISMYAADAWHPNTAGHELAGQILAKDLLQHFSAH